MKGVGSGPTGLCAYVHTFFYINSFILISPINKHTAPPLKTCTTISSISFRWTLKEGYSTTVVVRKNRRPSVGLRAFLYPTGECGISLR